MDSISACGACDSGPATTTSAEPSRTSGSDTFALPPSSRPVTPCGVPGRSARTSTPVPGHPGVLPQAPRNRRVAVTTLNARARRSRGVLHGGRPHRSRQRATTTARLSYGRLGAQRLPGRRCRHATAERPPAGEPRRALRFLGGPTAPTAEGQCARRTWAHLHRCRSGSSGLDRVDKCLQLRCACEWLAGA